MGLLDTMAVIVFMFHRTPPRAEQVWDVPLGKFKTQVQRMINSGVSFIRFHQAAQPKYLTKGSHVVLTFDDGHASNYDAFEYLSEKGIIPAAFVVRDWAEHRPEFLSSGTISSLSTVCDFGAHGVTHRDLTTLTEQELTGELMSSRTFLEDATGQSIRIMSLPGGRCNERVIRSARNCGYQVIGNSVFNANWRAETSVNRLCIKQYHSATYAMDTVATVNTPFLSRIQFLGGDRFQPAAAWVNARCISISKRLSAIN